MSDQSEQSPLFVPKRNGDAVVGYDAPEPPNFGRLARGIDTEASHEAARHLVASGRAATNMAAVEEALARQPWATSLELFCRDERLRKALGFDRAEVNRRLDSLRKAGRVVRMRSEQNPSLRRCEESHLHSQLMRWAVKHHTHLASRFLDDPAAVPMIERGTGNAEPLTREQAA